MDEINLSLSFNYDKSSYAIYISSNEEDFMEHQRELFCNCNFNSNFFMKYSKINSNEKNVSKYIFPFPTYGILDTFWAEQTNLQKVDKLNLKVKWIYQLTQGIKDLHSNGKYYGQLSSQCIAIDDKKNIKYSFLLKPLESVMITTFENASYFYLPPEYYNKEMTHDANLQELQSYDIYALGILINGIISESFPKKDKYQNFAKEDFIKMLKDPKNNNYPEKNQNDPFWEDFNNHIIDECTKPNNRPNIFDISKKLDQILQERCIINDYYYDETVDSLIQSSKDEKFKIPSLVRQLVDFNDIVVVLNILQKKYGDLSSFFSTELFFPSPFKSFIRGFDTQFSFSRKNFDTEKDDYFFQNTALPRFKEDLIEDENDLADLYSEISEDEYDKMEKMFSKSNAIPNFCFYNLPFCNLNQFLNVQRNNIITEKINIKREDILSWIIYLSDYMINLEIERNEKPLLPPHFSSETVLVSLLADSEGKPQLQLSIFPFPTEETQLSLIYFNDSQDIDIDIYSFGVLMFEMLSALPYNNEDPIVDFNSKALNSLLNKFHEQDESFSLYINIEEYSKLINLIENCLTCSSHFTFQMIKSYLYANFKDMHGVVPKYEYCLQNQCMTLQQFAAVTQMLNEDKIHSIIVKFLKDKIINESNSLEKDENLNDDKKNPFIDIFSILTKLEFDTDFIDPFNFIFLLKNKDDELSNEYTQTDFQSNISNIIHPLLDKVLLLKEKLLQIKQDRKEKCRKLKPHKLRFDGLSINAAYTSLTTIINNWSPTIPHTLLIKVNNVLPIINDDTNNNNDDDSHTQHPAKKLCTLESLEEFAKNTNIKYKCFKERSLIKIFFPQKIDIFDQIDDDDNLEKNFNEEEEFEEEEEEECNDETGNDD